MNRPARLLTAALTASAALLLTACGSGGDGGSSSEKIKGAETGDSKATATPSAAQPAGDRPAIPLPSTFTMTFENWTNSDPKLQAVLEDGKNALRADHAAVIAADPHAGYMTFYNEDAALESARSWVTGFVKTNDSLIGKVSVFAPQVRLNGQGLGVLFYCVDEGKAYTKNRKTNKVVGTPGNVSPYVQYRTTLQRTPQGVWKTRSVQTERGGCGR